MKLIPLGNGFAKLISPTKTIYFYRATSIPQAILDNFVFIDQPTKADAFTCEMAGLI